MALNKKSRGSILIGSIGSVAIIFGFVAAGFYPTAILQPTTPQPSPQPQEMQTEVIPDQNTEQNTDVPLVTDAPASEEFVWLSFPDVSNSVKADDSQQAAFAPESIEPVEVDLTVTDEQTQSLPITEIILECSVPETIRRSSTPVFSAIMFDSSLNPMVNQTIVWKVMPGDYTFTSVTLADGTTEVVPDLSDLALGSYEVTAMSSIGAQEATCSGSFELIYTYVGTGHGHNNNDDDDSATTRPVLRITMPSFGDSFTGPSSGGIPVYVTGTASDDGSIESVEVRWTPWYGELTGYRMANPNSSDDWSTWNYDGIKFSTEGSKRIMVKATDKDGNKSWKLATFDVAFTQDNTKPQIQINAPGEESVITGPAGGVSVVVTGTASDFYTGVQKVEVRTDMTQYEEATQDNDWSEWSQQVTFTTSGPHQIVARVTDNEGNMQWQMINLTIEFDEGDA